MVGHALVHMNNDTDDAGLSLTWGSSHRGPPQTPAVNRRIGSTIEDVSVPPT